MKPKKDNKVYIKYNYIEQPGLNHVLIIITKFLVNELYKKNGQLLFFHVVKQTVKIVKLI